MSRSLGCATPRRGPELAEKYGADKWKRVVAFKQQLRATAFPPDAWDSGNYGPGAYQAGKLLAAELPDVTTRDKEKEASA